MIGGAHGKILHVNLITAEIGIKLPPDDFYQLLAGNRTMVTNLLPRDLPPNTDPLGPDYPLIFVPGIMQGTNLPGEACLEQL